jgi:hypothetical protein
MARAFAHNSVFRDENALVFLCAVFTAFRAFVDYQIQGRHFHLTAPSRFSASCNFQQQVRDNGIHGLSPPTLAGKLPIRGIAYANQFCHANTTPKLIYSKDTEYTWKI